MVSTQHPFGDAHVIHEYTRQQAIEDGVLVDLSTWAVETGFTRPVACTAAVWSRYVTPPTGTRELGQSERGRAHDVLWMLYVAVRGGAAGDHVEFEVIFLQEPSRHETVSLKAVCGPGDRGEPVITVLLPDED